jgi:SpoIID/LytB domain protein
VSRNVVGAHAAGFNSQTFGVASLGNHDPASAGAVAPSSTELTSVGKLIAWKAWLNGWDPKSSATYTSAGNSKWPAGTAVTKPRISGHRDFNLTTCPGDLMVDRLATIRSTATAVYSGVTTSAITASPVVETYPRPAGGSFTVAGRGFGHGLGMSQYGAYGAALKGLTRDQILAFYYPGTTRSTSLGNASIRVRLTVAGSTGTQVVYQGGLAISDGTTTAALTGTNADGTPRVRWRVVPDGTGLTLQWLQGGVWRSTSSWKQVAGPLSFQNTTLNKVRVVLPNGVQRDYRRVVRTVRSGSGAMTLSVLSLNYYLQSVVPSEMPPSWSRAALEVQAVAARTFALREKSQKGSGALYDTCDSTVCQVYKGLAGYSSTGVVTPYENAATTAAVTATSGIGLLYGGAPALTQFSSSNGGQTVDSPLSYQVSKADPYDAVPSGSPSRWTTSLSVSRIEDAFPNTGTLRALRIDKRDGISQWGGRIRSITVIGSAASSTVSGSAFRTALGMRSTWWTVTSAPTKSAASFPKDLDGNRLADLLAVDGSAQLRLLSGNGSQGFSARVMAKAWGQVRLISNVGSWDGDNRHDVVERDAGTLYYHPGNGAGGFFPRIRISSGWDSVNLVTGPGDFDGDGHTDLLARTNTYGQLKLYRGDGKGGVAGTLLVGSGWNAYRLVVAPGDLTGDNRPDVLAVRASDNAMLLFPGTGTGAIGSPAGVAGSWGGYSALLGLGDMSGDGKDDLVGRRSSDGALVLIHGNDDRTLTPGAVVPGTATWAPWTRWAP